MKDWFKYTRKANNPNWSEDPTQKLNEVNFPYSFGETPFGKDNMYILRVDSGEPNGTVLQELNKVEGFQRSHLGDPVVIKRCNDNIDHKEGEEFTMVDGEIIDNRVLELI